MIKYILACTGGFIAGFIVAGFLITDELDDERNENIHLRYDLARLKRQLNPYKLS